MKPNTGILLGLVFSLVTGIASAETIEIVTYYPTNTNNNGTLRTSSLTVGNDYSNVAVTDGAAFISDQLAIGTTAPGASSILHAVGVNDTASTVLFTSGADTAAQGVPDIRVGIGTADPQGRLHVVGIDDAPDRVVFLPGQDTAAAGTPEMRVGIGTAAPVGNLHIEETPAENSAVATQLLLSNSGGGNHAAGIGFQTASEYTTYGPKAGIVFERTAPWGAGDMKFFISNNTTNAAGFTAADERMRITQTGTVGIGTGAPAASALLDMSSTTRGFLPPRMTTAQRDAIAGPVAGLMVYNTSTNQLNFYNGATWTALVDSGRGITQVVFASAGTTNWTVPAGVTGITVEVWGGGGGGGGSPNAGGAAFGHGGGGGGYGRQLATVTPGATLTITVGAGGTGQKTNSNPGATGGTSTVSGLTSPASISATGGRGGSAGGIEGAIIGRGGTSTATFNISGQDAVAPFFTLYQRAGGAGGNGGMGSVGELNSTRFIGTDGTAPGGGGCGWFARTPSGSNNGAPGRVVITY